MASSAAAPWLRLIRAPGLGSGAALRLLRHFGAVESLVQASAAAWRKAGVERREALPADDDPAVVADLAWLAADPARRLIGYSDPLYPEALRGISSPPLALFVVGDPALLAQPQLAVVGSRAATPQGLDNARAFAAELARRGLIVTSGLALGVDGAAHRGALDAAGATIAVCGTGLDRVYPARHKALAHELVQRGGALVSELAPGAGALRQHFPSRNRIISALSLGVLVVEASQDSGSLITARLAAEQGREVFAIPGSIHNPLARGCHRLIREGAKLVESVDDILLELAPRLGAWLREAGPTVPSASGPGPESLDPEARQLLSLLGDAPLAVDRLVASSGLSAASVNAALLHLELAGLAASHGGGYQRLGG
ncbi:MAG: DNA-processing protein DprA [Stagnimonas sp.]|nr:DNA-processing protein DprA [Stagnimonas sp.]